MKKLLAYSVLFFAVIIAIDGCKKGPEDPFLSFRSRKKRVEGYWKVVKVLQDNIDSTQYVHSNYTLPVSGDPDFACGKHTYTYTRDWEIKFRFDGDGRYEKDSTWKFRQAESYEHPSTQQGCENSDSLYYDLKTITKGFWMFAGGTNDIGNKERMFLTDGEDQYSGVSYDILQCREKEMKLVYSVSILGPDGLQVKKIQYNMESTDAFDSGN